MHNVRFNNIRITGISAAVPKKVINNQTSHTHINAEEKTKTINLTGIKEYRMAGPSICTSDLCLNAAENLILSLKISPTSIDAILFVSQTPDYKMPSTACILQDKLGCGLNTVAYDINLGCSGFIYGLFTACSFIQGARLERVLLLCGDTQTKLSYKKDKNVSFILGDAGTATLIENEQNSSDIIINLLTDGSGYDNLIVPAGGFRYPSNDETRKVKIQEDGQLRSKEHLFMSGMDIFNFSVTKVVNTIREFMESENINPAKLDYLVLHQANKFMTDKIARKLKIPLENVPYSMEKFGNTSSASIPLTIVNSFNQGEFRGTNNCVLSGFGVGLSWGVININIKDIICPEIYEV
jgi:3-oxoacyl-[acyl-carrier-protein] synthase-3